MVESSALLKRRSPKGYRGFESLPHRFLDYQVLKTREPECINTRHNKCVEIRQCSPTSKVR